MTWKIHHFNRWHGILVPFQALITVIYQQSSMPSSHLSLPLYGRQVQNWWLKGWKGDPRSQWPNFTGDSLAVSYSRVILPVNSAYHSFIISSFSSHTVAYILVHTFLLISTSLTSLEWSVLIWYLEMFKWSGRSISCYTVVSIMDFIRQYQSHAVQYLVKADIGSHSLNHPWMNLRICWDRWRQLKWICFSPHEIIFRHITFLNKSKCALGRKNSWRTDVLINLLDYINDTDRKREKKRCDELEFYQSQM